MDSLFTHIDGKGVQIQKKWVEKYSGPTPRYTSYPTVPCWKKEVTIQDYKNTLEENSKADRPLSLYIHIPFCRERCHFCGCNVVATQKTAVVEPYFNALQNEIKQVASTIGTARPVIQIHWGGGTPTYLSTDQIERLFSAIASNFSIAPSAEIAIEADPRATTLEHLKKLRSLGFNRISLGVQDFDPQVQQAIGRVQPYEKTKKLMVNAREMGFQSINCDLIYGLPRQTLSSFHRTLEELLLLSPDRLSLFNFAYLPEMQPNQKNIHKNEIPDVWEKMKLFCMAIEFMQNHEYHFLGLDHFAKKTDELSLAKSKGTLARNFQGHTVSADYDLIGFGVSAISQVHGNYFQNNKKLAFYQKQGLQQGFATERGLFLNEEDRTRQWIIQKLFCQQGIDKAEFQERYSSPFDDYFSEEKPVFCRLQEEGLIQNTPKAFQVTKLGRLFIRNIGTTFDTYLK